MSVSDARRRRGAHSHPSRTRSLKEIIHDPDAAWCDVRESLKSSGGCTNVASFLIAARGDAGGSTPGAQDGTSSHSGDEAKVTAKDTATRAPESSGDRASSTPEPEPEEDNGGIGILTRRQPAALGRPEGSGRELNSSVNLMDFGVDNQSCVHLDCSFSSVSHSSGDTDVSGSGFVGWDHSRRRVANEEASLLKQRSHSILVASIGSSDSQSNGSDLVDEEGFLDWKRSSLTLNDLHGVESEGAGVEDFCDLNHPDLPPSATHADGPNPLRNAVELSLQSFNASIAESISNSFSFNPFSKSDQRKDWKIECYEDPRDNEDATRLRRGKGFPARRRGLRPLSSSGTAEPLGAASDKGEVSMDLVREALIKVSSNRSFTAPAPFQRSQTNHNGVHPIAGDQTSHSDTEHLPKVDDVSTGGKSDAAHHKRSSISVLSDTQGLQRTETEPALIPKTKRVPTSEDASMDSRHILSRMVTVTDLTVRGDSARVSAAAGDACLLSDTQGLQQTNAEPAMTTETKKVPTSGDANIDPRYILSRMVTVADLTVRDDGAQAAAAGDVLPETKQAAGSSTVDTRSLSEQFCALARKNNGMTQGVLLRPISSKNLLPRIPLLSSTEIETDVNIWKDGSKGSTHQLHLNDTREAIFINRRDGDVDIAKERRKLYSGEQEGPKSPWLLRRPSASSSAALSRGYSSGATLSRGSGTTGLLSSLGSRTSALGLERRESGGSKGRGNADW